MAYLRRVTPNGGQASDQVNTVGQAGAGDTGDRSEEGHAHSGQIRSESPSIADTDPGGSPPRTAGNDTHRSVGLGELQQVRPLQDSPRIAAVQGTLTRYPPPCASICGDLRPTHEDAVWPAV